MTQNTPIQDTELIAFLANEDTFGEDHREIAKLMQIGRTRGFQKLVNRKKIWPVILEVNIEQLHQSSDFLQWNKSKQTHSSDYDQLQKDAMRSFHSFKPFQNIDEDYLKKKQDQLLQVLDALSKNEPKYKYFQGFHDIASIFISMFGMNTAYYMSHKLATTYMRDNFLMSFDETVMILDKLIWQIVVQRDTDFLQIFSQFDEHKLGFTMSWIITWFAHNFQDIDIISRIWDYLISSKPSAIVYVSSAFILKSKQKLIAFTEQMGMGNDPGAIHSFYQNIKNHEFNIEQVLALAIELQKKYPLQKLSPSKELSQQTIIKPENFIKHFSIHQYLHQLLLQKNQKQKRIKYAVIFTGMVVIIGLTIWKKRNMLNWIGINSGEL